MLSHNGKTYPHQEVESGCIIVKHSYDCVLPTNKLIEIPEKNTLITINCGAYFHFGIFYLRSIIMLGICLVFANIFFQSIFTQYF